MEKKRANSIITTALNDEGKTLTFSVLGAGELHLDLTALGKAVIERALVHGMKQRISDAAAIPCNPETGKPATPQEKFEAMQALVEHYNSGTDEWAIGRVGGGGAPRAANTLQAIANVYSLDLDGARAYVEKTAAKRGIDYKAALALWKSSDKIAEELARMAAAKSKVDADGLLDELN